MVVLGEQQQQTGKERDADADEVLSKEQEHLYNILHVGQDAALVAGKVIRDALSSRTTKRQTQNDDNSHIDGLRDISITIKNSNNNNENDDDEKQQQHSLSTDLVTETDHKCEELIIKKIRKYYPNDKIIGEETTACSSNTNAMTSYELTNDPTWTIDPIDGTTNFVHGLHLSCILISYIMNQDVKVGITYDPYADELFYAIKGYGSYMIKSASTTTLPKINTEYAAGSSRIFVSQCTQSIREAVISMDPGYGRTHEAVTKYCNIQKQILCRGVRNIRVFGCTGLNMAYVACGRLDGGFEVGSWSSDLGPKIWDFAPGKLLVEEAGGITIDLEHNTGSDDNKTTINGEESKKVNKNNNNDNNDSGNTAVFLPPLDLLNRSFFCAANRNLANEMIQAIKEC